MRRTIPHSTMGSSACMPVWATTPTITRNVIGHPELIEQVGDFAVMTANEKDYIATRLAFEFDLRGPALSIHTACSTSLVAIAQAFKALRDGECDMALAGGIAITVPIQQRHRLQRRWHVQPRRQHPHLRRRRQGHLVQRWRGHRGAEALGGCRARQRSHLCHGQRRH
jgi:hypothetical protein